LLLLAVGCYCCCCLLLLLFVVAAFWLLYISKRRVLPHFRKEHFLFHKFLSISSQECHRVEV
jgi:hypothetical protein